MSSMKNIVVLSLSLLFIVSCQTRSVKEVGKAPLLVVSGGLEPGILLDHRYFLISYNKTERLPNWVLYRLEASQVGTKKAKRRDRFFADPLLVARGIDPVKPKDYEGKNYDRGHMAPSEDFTWDQAANDMTFVMSNMAPQKAALNRGSWKTLEGKVRRWACTEKDLRIVTGPVPAGGLPTMFSGVSIPRQFFKVILDNTPPRKTIAFVFSQEDGKVSYKERAVSMETVEKLTGYRFFNDVSERDILAARFDINKWVESNCGDFAQ
ncbi:Nuclease precursor [compost metagenome]